MTMFILDFGQLKYKEIKKNFDYCINIIITGIEK